ncbi:hypothetical protein BsIDN1_53350 [Bacillus safensis]|uniref:16S rRNA (Cytosine(1402)-N(4))-methyltransferase n=1 Tax=Bacillus safensis TaxID=561879 RepID=A0A5S9ME18_BACIA|nr:hypothetical protein BsIDN1_53350 [Bacillus safensis]
MILKRMLPFFSKELLERACQKGDIVIDATMGNGHDTLYLADLVGTEGQVFAFDVQEEALQQTSKRLGGQYPYVHLIHDGHEKLADHLRRMFMDIYLVQCLTLGICQEAIKPSPLRLIQPLKPSSSSSNGSNPED